MLVHEGVASRRAAKPGITRHCSCRVRRSLRSLSRPQLNARIVGQALGARSARSANPESAASRHADPGEEGRWRAAPAWGIMWVVAKPALDLSSLTPEEKLDLIDELWQSLGSEDLVLSPELRAELDRRLERIDREGPHGVPWEQVRAEMSRGGS
jgi:putative addiction module component (TIGR02574 family)